MVGGCLEPACTLGCSRVRRVISMERTQQLLLSIGMLVLAAMLGWVALSQFWMLPRRWVYYASTPLMPSGCKGLEGSAYWHCMLNSIGGDVIGAFLFMLSALFLGYLAIGLFRVMRTGGAS